MALPFVLFAVFEVVFWLEDRTQMSRLPDDALVVRGGMNLPANFIQGSGVSIGPDGKMDGVSVNAGAGISVAELTAANPATGYAGILNRQVGVTTAGEVRAAGGDIVPSPTRANPHHATLSGLTPEQASTLFRPTVPNPSPRRSHRHASAAGLRRLPQPRRRQPAQADLRGDAGGPGAARDRTVRGAALNFYMDDANEAGQRDDLLVDGMVRHDEAGQGWVATVDWTAVRHASDDAARNGSGKAAESQPAGQGPHG